MFKSRKRLEAVLQQTAADEMAYSDFPAGRTHLSAALSLKAIAGYRVFFTTAANLITALTKAHTEGRLEEKLKFYTTPRLLIIDEIGYLPIDRFSANLLFQHECRPTILQQPKLRRLGRCLR